jgi:hemerythrin-like domain-containing protein
VHAEAEEQILYPAMEEFNETEDLADEAYEEHGEVKQLLEDMTGLNPSDEKFQSLLAELKAGIQHHVAEEEGEMFPKAEELLGEEALQTMGDEIEAFKGEATGGTSNIATA